MRRIAIIDHENHNLYIEDINEKILEEMYGGDEQKYIDDNYNIEGEYSWDYIVSVEYFPENDDVFEVDLKEIYGV